MTTHTELWKHKITLKATFRYGNEKRGLNKRDKKTFGSSREEICKATTMIYKTGWQKECKYQGKTASSKKKTRCKDKFLDKSWRD